MDNQYNNQQNDPYNQPVPPQGGFNPPPVSFKEWMIAILLLALPVVNIVMLFVWAFGSNTNPSKANYAKASLIWGAIIIVLYFVLWLAVLVPLLAANNVQL